MVDHVRSNEILAANAQNQADEALLVPAGMVNQNPNVDEIQDLIEDLNRQAEIDQALSDIRDYHQHKGQELRNEKKFALKFILTLLCRMPIQYIACCCVPLLADAHDLNFRRDRAYHFAYPTRVYQACTPLKAAIDNFLFFRQARRLNAQDREQEVAPAQQQMI